MFKKYLLIAFQDLFWEGEKPSDPKKNDRFKFLNTITSNTRSITQYFTLNVQN